MSPLNDDLETHNLGSKFAFTGTRIKRLKASEYTLVNILVDESGSVESFKVELRNMLVTAVQACHKSARASYLLVRVALFSSRYLNGGVRELHGFKLLQDINPDDYPEISPGGGTPLYDVCYTSVAAMNDYGKKLSDSEFLTNGITFIITDGDDTGSTATRQMVKEEIGKSISGEVIESHTTILIGINAGIFRHQLETFQQEAGLTQYIDAGDVSTGSLAKVAAFVSRSVSSASQAVGTGGPSQDIDTSI